MSVTRSDAAVNRAAGSGLPRADPQNVVDRRGLALREMLLVIALLTIAFGLMVSLARGVRSEAAHSLVQRELLELEEALAAYKACK